MGKLLAADNIVGSTFLGSIPADTYEGYQLYISGTNNAANDLDPQDIGTVRLLINGIDYVNVNYQELLEFNRLMGGMARDSSTTGAAFEHSLIIPRGFFDSNVELIDDIDLAQLSIQWGPNVSTKVASGTVELYGMTRKTGTQMYNLKMIGVQESIGGAGTFPVIFREENIIAIYPRLTARASATAETNLTRIRAEVDGRENCNIVREALRYQSYNRRRNDSSEVTKVGEILFAEQANIGEYLTDSVKLDVTAAAAITFDTMVVAADFNPAKQKTSAARSGEVLDQAIRRKMSGNKTRPVAVLESALGIPSRR